MNRDNPIMECFSIGSIALVIVVQRMFLLVYLSMGKGSGKMLYFGAETNSEKAEMTGKSCGILS